MSDTDKLLEEIIETMADFRTRLIELERETQEAQIQHHPTMIELYSDQAVGKAQIINDVLLTKDECDKRFAIIEKQILQLQTYARWLKSQLK